MICRLAALALFLPYLAVAGPESAAFVANVSGQGPPMILIAGLGASGAVWDGTVKHFAGRYECHVLTLAGSGGAPPIKGALLPRVDAALAAYLGERHLERPVLVGHNLGGTIALGFAERHPGMVGALVIIDTLPALGAAEDNDIPAAGIERQAARSRDEALNAPHDPKTRREVAATLATRPVDIDRVLAMDKASDRRAIAEATYEMMKADLRPGLPAIVAPTLVLGSWVAYRDVASRRDVEDTFRLQFSGLRDVTLALSESARHYIMYDDPGWMLGQMDRFLKPRQPGARQ
ncbi:alpha/beta fold hydrolase [Paludibacterium paludis]|uniref:alpha/beta fold hydrolase n=1 Tax=Paludibacterium paludis TaxID=1225769 RepID=UPI00167B7146|nr:alpha/beta hydrolase [Paludibacterium paludis]